MTHLNITSKLSESCGGKCLCKEICRIITWSDILNINFLIIFKLLAEWEELRGYVLGWSLLMNYSFIWVTHVILCSNNTVGSLWTGNSQIAWMYWVADINYTHSWLTSWSVMTSAWLEKATISVCFCERQEIVVHIHVNTYPIWDLTLCGYDR